jgi:hypothetical protein
MKLNNIPLASQTAPSAQKREVAINANKTKSAK